MLNLGRNLSLRTRIKTATNNIRGGFGIDACSTVCYTLDMRTTLNISMPISLKRSVDLAVKEGSYASVSEFFRDAVRAWEEEQLYQSVMRSKRDFAQGKFKRLRSLKDLM